MFQIFDLRFTIYDSVHDSTLHALTIQRLFVFHRHPVAADQDKPVRGLALVARPIALGQQTPGGSQLLPAAAGLGLASAAAVRMVHRVARHAAVDRANAAMPRATGFAENDVFVLRVADLPDRGVAILVDLSNLTRRETNQRVAFVARHQRRSEEHT